MIGFIVGVIVGVIVVFGWPRCWRREGANYDRR